jgi:hypothetical protein
VTWLYDDSIRDATADTARWERIKAEVGEAVLKICLDPQMAFDERPMETKPITYHPIGNSVNGANLCDKVHSTEERLYLWSGNRLRPLYRLSERELGEVARLVAAERAVRKQTSQ